MPGFKQFVQKITLLGTKRNLRSEQAQKL